MKMKQTYAIAIALILPLFSLTCASAQSTPLPSQAQEHILISTDSISPARETLSGINLTPTGKGTFQLDFSQELDENATLEVKNSAGKMVYQKPVSIANAQTTWRYNLGKLRAGTYLIEVKTSDTTYWTKFKVGR